MASTSNSAPPLPPRDAGPPPSSNAVDEPSAQPSSGQTNYSGVPHRKPVPTASDSAAATTATTTTVAANSSPYLAPKHEGPVTSSRWSRLTGWIPFQGRKKKFFIIGLATALVVVLALIIGLSVGLTRHSGSSIDSAATTTGTTHSGDLTYFTPALGACGITSDSSSHIAAVSHILFDASSTSSNPNANPLCGRKIRVMHGSKKMDLEVVDRCVGCAEFDIDTSSTVFKDLIGDLDVGRTTVTWVWLAT